MVVSVVPMGADEAGSGSAEASGFGALRTERGNLPLEVLGVAAAISGLVARTTVVAEFVNGHGVALEATYIFPLPDRGAVTSMRMTAGERTVEAELEERAAAREAYDDAVAAGRRASIAEEERPDVFTIRVGNILPGERVSVALELVGPLPFEDGAATYRFPLVVAPRYIPGVALPGPSVGDGTALDTHAVPDASRITPPVLLPGFPNPVRLSIGVTVDPAGLELGEVRSSLHTVVEEDGVLRAAPGGRADRDFILRLAYAGSGQSAVAVPDRDADEKPVDSDGTYQLVVLPPEGEAKARPRDVVLLLDRSGSMAGWKMVAARRAAARIADTLTDDDRLAVITFDDRSDVLGDDGMLMAATDRHRFRAVEFLAQTSVRGGTDILGPLLLAMRLLAGGQVLAGEGRISGERLLASERRRGLRPGAFAADGRDRVVVLVTDGEVGNEDQILAEIAPLIGNVRVHAIGIDQAVNAGFLGRLAAVGGGRAELVESEDRLDEAMEHIHRRIGTPLVTGLAVAGNGIRLVDDERSPARLPGLFAGVPLVITGRYEGEPSGTLEVTGVMRDGTPFRTSVPVLARDDRAVTWQWARARVRDMEDAFTAGDRRLENRIVDTSLRYGVLCRFTAFVAVGTRVVNAGGGTRRVTQPVELPAGWASGEPEAFRSGTKRTSTAWLGLVEEYDPGVINPGSAMPSPRGAFGARSNPGGRRTAPMRGRKSVRTVPAGFAAVAPVRERESTPAMPMREIAATEADRLRAAAGAPDAERRDLLDDLLSRLVVLTAGVDDPADAPLLGLIEVLRGGASLDEKWTVALETLAAFGAGPLP